MHNDEHLSDEAKVAYAETPGGFPHLDTHVQRCGECRHDVEVYRTLITSFRQPETWWLNRRLESDRTALEARNVDERLALEDADAERVLKEFIEEEYKFASANVTAKRRYRTGGFVRRLCAAALEKCYSNPKYALVLAGSAQVIASLLSDDTYPANLVNKTRGDAWKDYATVCRYLAKFDEGYKALVKAEQAYKKLADDGVGLAAVNHSRAQMLCKQKRNAEALPLARAAAQEYEDRGMTQRYTEATETIAVILHDLGDTPESYSLYNKIYYAADDLDDPAMKARAAKALGIMARDQGDFGAASMHFLTALQLYESMGSDVMVIRMQWSLARLVLKVGQYRAAAEKLKNVSAAFRDKGLRGDAADVDLDRVEAHLLLHEAEEAETICSDLLLTFLEINAVAGALTAMSYLKEIAAKRKLAPRHVIHVREFLAELKRDPKLLFALPPEIF